MKTDRISGIVIFAIGAAVLVTSLSYPVGTLRNPGGGFFPLLASVLLLVLSAVFTVQSFTAKADEDAGAGAFFPGEDARKRVVLGVVGLLGYRYLIPVIGFAPATGVFIFFLGKFLESYTWKKSVFFSAATAVSAYYLFQVVLKIQMPIPMLKF
ncbi:MAG: tripartite tricarboxylate transporter TctB family protein [Hyphomicrobiales bacterium]